MEQSQITALYWWQNNSLVDTGKCECFGDNDLSLLENTGSALNANLLRLTGKKFICQKKNLELWIESRDVTVTLQQLGVGEELNQMEEKP